MKILIYATDFWPSIGGVQSVVMALARGLVGRRTGEEGISVVVATRTPASQTDDRSLPFRVVRRPSTSELMRLVRNSDLVHLAGPSFVPLLLSLALGKPVVMEHHGFQAVCPNGQLFYEPSQEPCPGHFMAGRHSECWRCNSQGGWHTSLKIWALTFPRRWLCRAVTANVVPTRWLGELLDLPRSTVILHGVAERPPATTGVPETSPTFVFLGRLVSTKGAAILLRAVEKLLKKGVRFHVKIIGEGPMRAALKAEAAARGIDDAVSFLGYLPDTELETTLAGATAVVMPSLGGEVFGLVAADNMMAGRLVILSDLGALAEVVGPAGMTFKTGDPDSLAECLERVIRSPEMAERIGKEARRRCMEFYREERMIEMHLSLYRSLRAERAGIC